MLQIKDILERVNHFRENIPVDVKGLAMSLGINVSEAFLPPNVSGIIQNLGKDQYQITVNAKHSETRKRFTIAHELGHFVLHRFLMGDGNVDDCAYRSDGSFKNNKIGPREETEANKFAANLLMPADKIVQFQDEHNVQTTIGLAKRFQVSEGAMKIRLGRQD